jgi:hypothetical protein
MERGDIAIYERPERACLFEGLIASPTKRRVFKFRPNDDITTLKGWVAHELPLKTLIDQTNRLDITTAVFTTLGTHMEDDVYRWLTRRGVSCPVYAFDSLAEAVEAYRYNFSFHTIYVPTTELAQMFGIRATAVDPLTSWGI